MKPAIAEEILKVTRPTLLKKVKDNDLPVNRTASGEYVFNWSDVAQLYQILNFPKLKKFTLSFVQNKGGVGKTTTVYNLAHLFSAIGKTLVVDMDGQGNLTQSYDLYMSKDDITVKDILQEPEKTKESIVNINDNLSIIPNSVAFGLWTRTAYQIRNAQYLLQKALNTVKQDYDFILIDCSPTMEIPFDLTIYASDYVAVMMEPHPYSLENLENLLSLINVLVADDMSGMLKDKLNVLGLVVARYKDTVVTRQLVEEAKANGYDVFNTKIRDNVQIVESQAFKIPVFTHQESCNGSNDYFKLWVELMEKIHG